MATPAMASEGWTEKARLVGGGRDGGGVEGDRGAGQAGGGGGEALGAGEGAEVAVVEASPWRRSGPADAETLPPERAAKSTVVPGTGLPNGSVTLTTSEEAEIGVDRAGLGVAGDEGEVGGRGEGDVEGGAGEPVRPAEEAVRV